METWTLYQWFIFFAGYLFVLFLGLVFLGCWAYFERKTGTDEDYYWKNL